MNMHFSKGWVGHQPYLRRGHILALLRHTLLIYRVAALIQKEMRERRRLQTAFDEMPDYLRRDIGLL